MSIPEAKGQGKEPSGRISADLLLILILLLACSAAFGLGFLTGREAGTGGEGDRVWIEQLTKEGSTLPAAAAVATKEPKVTAGEYVGSKSGTKYHLLTCPGAKSIKEENKVWFSTKEQATAAGYGPAANCPGL